MENLRSLYRQGFIPGPDEEEVEFQKRLALFRKEKVKDSPISLEEREKAFSIIFSLYQIMPDWVEVVVTSKGLRFWEAGAAWETVDGRWTICLNPKQRLTERAEVLGHEAVHAVRAAFDEQRFEEILAFRTSTKSWRRFFGPLIQRPREVWILFAAIFFDCLWTMQGKVACATLLISSLGLIRLLWNQWRFACCVKHLPSPTIAICLTDREIVTLAKGVPFSSLDDGSLRWRTITACVNERLANASYSDI